MKHSAMTVDPNIDRHCAGVLRSDLCQPVTDVPGCYFSVSQQLPCFDFEILVDEWGGHVFGERIERQRSLVFEVVDDFVTPVLNIRCGPGTPEFRSGFR